MKELSILKLMRWCAAAALVAGTLSYAAPSSAAPFKRLFVFLNRTGPAGCAADANGQPYYADAYGTTNTLATVCATGTTGSTGQVRCNNTAVFHSVGLLKLQTNGIMLGLNVDSPLQQTWTSSTATGVFNIPSHATCPAGNTAKGSSWGAQYN